MENHITTNNNCQTTPLSSPLVIAITGHRFIEFSHPIIQAVNSVLSTIIEAHPDKEIELLNPLAEGADQLVAQESRNFINIHLVSVLPLPIDEYKETFVSEEGKIALDSYVKTSKKVITLPRVAHPSKAYQQLGKFLVEKAEILIALWNGEKSNGFGGTGEVVELAQQFEKSVYWIYVDNLKKGVSNSFSKIMHPGEINCI